MRKLGKVMITGHAGYVGSALLPHLVQRARSIDLCDTNWFVDDPLYGGRDFRKLQVADLAGIDTIIHLAGLSNDTVATHFPDTNEAFEVSTFATTARDAGVARFAFASSAAVYNDGDTPCHETDEANPHSGYAKSKFDSERLLEAVSNDDFQVAVVRLASCFGWAPMLRPDLLINRMTARALDNEALQLASNGTSSRPFVHVEDAAVALCLAGEVDIDGFEIVNVVGEDANLTVGDALATIVRALDSAGVDATVLPSKPRVDERSYTLDGSKFRAMGFVPRWTIHDGVIDLVNRLRVRGSGPASAVEVDRATRLVELRSSNVINDLLQQPVRDESANDESTNDEVSAPLVTPAAVDDLTLHRILDAQKSIMAQSQYRLTGAYSTKVEELLFNELDLQYGWDVLALRSGTDSLTRALWLAGVRPGSKVVMADLSFHAVAATVMSLGAEPVITDITSDTWNLDPALVEAELSKQEIAAVVAVDNYGTPADWPALGTACRTAGVPLIVDACESLGATRPDSSVGEHADYIAMSFSFTKPIHAAGMGGALCAPSSEIKRVMAAPEQLVRQARLPELNAVYLAEAWPSLHHNIAHLRAIYDIYSDALVPRGFQAQHEVGVSTRIHAPFLLPAELADRREELLSNADSAGVQARAQFPSQARLLSLGVPPPVSADVDSRVVSLPSGAALELAIVPALAEKFLEKLDGLLS